MPIPDAYGAVPPSIALIEEHYPRFLERLEAEGVSLPHLVNEEFEAYLNYGRLEYGILRVKCDACRHEKEVARLMVPVGATLARYPPSWP